MKTKMKNLPLICGCAFLMCFQSLEAGGAGYPNPPEVIKSLVEGTAQDIIKKRDSQELGAQLDEMVLYTVADALILPKTDGEEKDEFTVRMLKSSSPLLDTIRTDKQVGTSPTSSGSTTLVEKAGFAEIFGFAFEHGAIQKDDSGTNLTLSTSPYSLMRLFNFVDTAKNFERFQHWRRLGISATFDTAKNNTATSMGMLDSKDLQELSVKLRFYGDRSTRTLDFVKKWEDQGVKQAYQDEVNKIGKALSAAFNVKRFGANDKWNAEYIVFRKKIMTAASKVSLPSRGTSMTTQQETDKKNEFVKLILTILKEEIYDAVKEDEGKNLLLSEERKNLITKEIIRSLAPNNQAVTDAQKKLAKLLEEHNRSMVGTIAYTLHQGELGSDYSEGKILFEGFIDPVEIVANAGISLRHDPNGMAGQSTIRDYSAAVSVEGKFDNFEFIQNLNSANFSKATISASARIVRLEDQNDEMGIGQAKLEIPIAAGISFPISVTWATRTEFINEEEVRGNFGFTFDFDKLLALGQNALTQ